MSKFKKIPLTNSELLSQSILYLEYLNECNKTWAFGELLRDIKDDQRVLKNIKNIRFTLNGIWIQTKEISGKDLLSFEDTLSTFIIEKRNKKIDTITNED